MTEHEKRIREAMEKASGFSDNDLRALLADLDAMRVKAVRYDWLRDEAVLFGHDDGSPSAWAVVGTGYEDCNPIQGGELDAAIDAALKGASA